MNCLWTVHSLVAGEHISASFGPFDTVSGDILSIYDGPSTSSPLLASYTGSYTPAPPVSSSGSSLTFNFVSDAANSAAAGFTISAVAFVPTQTRTRSRTRTRTRTRRTRTRTRTRIPPVLSGVQPAAVAPTATLTLTGSNFGTSAASAGVFINGVACGITAIAAGQILCTVPWILPRNYSVWVVVGAAASGLRSVQVVGEAGSLALVIRTGHQHNCIAVPATGLTYCWGNNGNGQLGIGNTNAIGDQPGEMPPQAAIIGAPYFDIHLGRYHTCVLNTDRLGVRCIGRNTYGQLGNGDFGSPATDIGDALGELPPATVAIAGPATTLNLSGRTTCALLQNATVQCWGDNTYGQLGYVTPTQMERPGPLANFGAAQIVQIANGFDFMCVLSSVGSVYCIGNNAAGIAGLGGVTGNLTAIGDQAWEYPFTTLNLGGTVAQLALNMAEAHCCALLTTGAVKCWGRTSFGNSGTGVSVGNIGDAPGEMPPASTILPSSWVVRTLTTRGDFSCALLEVGEMNCWGPGPTGQLGLATGAIAVLATPSPTYIALGMAKVTAFSQGEVNVCALMTDSDIKCWGRASQGQLGFGSATQNIGDAVGEMPPPSVALRPLLFSVTPGVVYAPTSTVTLVGANFGSVGANLSVLIGTVPCALTMVTPLHLECTPQYVAAGYFNVTVTRLGGFGTSAPAGPVRVLPSNPIILSMSPASGGVGVNISMSVLGLSTIPATTVEFRPRNGTACVTGCTGNVTAVDAVGQSLTVTVPALPSFAEYDVVVTTPTGSSALPSAAVFLYCTDACDACAGTASQCTKCRESLGYHFNIEGTQCVNTACPGNQVLTARTGALRCGCNQTAGFFANSAGTSCVQACAAREYLDVAPVNYICRACHVSCLACLDSSASSCTACPSGVILQLQGGVGNQCVGSCSLCGNGLVSAGNSSQCSCPPGTFYDYGKRSCYPCPGNSYNSQYLDPELVSSQSCTRCPAYTEIVGTGSNRTSVSECVCRSAFVPNTAANDGSCVCPAGSFYDSATSTCLNCEQDTFSSSDGIFSSCTPCPGAFRTTAGLLGQTSSTACVCPLTMVGATSGDCTCAPGSYFESATTSCRLCPQNSFSANFNTDPQCTLCSTLGSYRVASAGANDSSACVCPSSMVEDLATGDCTCAPGQYFESATATCRPCPSDSFSANFHTNPQCTLCSTLGSYRVASAGANDSSACVCPSSMVEDLATGDCTCAPHPLTRVCTCAPGQSLERATTTCRTCPMDSFSASFNTDPQCTLCSTVGLYRVASAGANDSSACVCPSSMVEHPLTRVCTCAPGQYFESATTTCRTCPMDSFSASFNTDPQCTLCATVGNLRSTAGISGANSSSICLCPSSMEVDSTGSCICKSGQYFVPTPTALCVDCQAGTFSQQSGIPTQCTSCATLGPFRSTGNLLGRNSSLDCKCFSTFEETSLGCFCPPGTFYDSGNVLCTQCPPNTFNDEFSLSNLCKSCDDVGPLRITRGAGSNSSAACVCPSSMLLSDSGVCVCEAGYYFLESEQSCRICPANTFLGGQNTAGSCTPCSSLGAHLTTNEVQGRSRPSDCVCEAGFYPSLSTGQCLECSGLAGAARCEGASANTATSGRNLTQVELAGINVQYGYWLTTDAEYLPLTKWSARKYRADWFIIVKCPIAAGCPGGTAEELCATGYTGPACGSCSHGYGRLGGECAACPQPGSLSGFLVFLIIAIIVFGYYFALRRFARAETPKPLTEATIIQDSMGIKFAINHLQLIGFMGGFAASWPRSMAKVLSIPTASATISAVFANIGVECSGSLSLNAFAALLFTLPLLLALCVAAIYLYAGIRSQNFDRYWDKTFQGTLILLYVAHPGIVQGVLKLMSCYDVGRQSFALIDMSVDCNSQSFRGLRGFAVFYFLVYCVGGLIGMFFLLRQRPTEYQFMTKCYKPKYYFYDIIVSLRQTLFVIVALFASPPLQLYFGTWILVLSWVSQHILRPYRHTLPSNLDSLSLFVLLLTTTTGSLFFNEVLSPTQGGGVAVAVILIILNLGTVALFLFFAAGTAKDTDSFKKVRKVLSRSLSRAEIKANAIHDSQFPAIELKPI
eukprot:TRINITY_DN4_c0_g1_i14.p1 TRINITY_DN4_c0_g1~~TRINITY_DN4_c0_g1_i14.p1  ORF type:complete len:2125 (-),score=335.12 TRINITY_DN4_c0_g1_i14:129-6365(-)